jgi:hypothetical protein
LLIVIGCGTATLAGFLGLPLALDGRGCWRRWTGVGVATLGILATFTLWGWALYGGVWGFWRALALAIS